MKKLEPSNPSILSPRQFEKEFGSSLCQQEKMRMRKSKENDGDYALPFFKIGKKVFYQRDAIMEWFSKLQERERDK